jgi:pimeloyl-ACP methyl ester carboxylesterase
MKIDGRHYHLRIVGPANGTPVLLLHGFPFTSESFWPQLDAPPQGVRLIVPDHRGFGQSELAPGISTMEAMAQDALKALDQLGIVDVIAGGVSMGGYIAMALTRLEPARVRGLILIDTQATADDSAAKERREATAKDLETNGMGNSATSMLPRLLAPEARPYVRARVDSIIRGVNPVAAAAAARGMAARDDSREILSRYNGPALIIVGEKDEITPVEKSKAMSELIKGSKLSVIPGVGHLANLEAPQLITQAIADFAR